MDPEFYSIIASSSPRNRKAVEAITSTIKANGDLFSFKNGCPVINGNVIPGSNYEDLIHKTVNANVKTIPNGYEDFISTLAKTKLGSHWVRDTAGKKLLISSRTAGFVENGSNQPETRKRKHASGSWLKF